MDITQMFDRVAKAKALGEAYRKVFSSSEGRLVLEDLMSVSGITRGVRSGSQEMAHQHEAVRLFVFAILKKTGMKQQKIVEAVYTKIKEIEDGPAVTTAPPTGADVMPVTHNFASPGPEDL